MPGKPKTSKALALVTALCVAATLLYVFLLLVPAWRLIHIDTDYIDALLANSTKTREEISKQREALTSDPLLYNRTANAFRECLLLHHRSRRHAEEVNSTTTMEKRIEMLQLTSRLLSILAGSVNATIKTGQNQSSIRPNLLDHCWFIDLFWSSASPVESLPTDSLGVSLLSCTRAIFLLAASLLICYGISLTGTLYACFASKLPSPCLWLLLIVHCLSLTQLVAVAILQDKTAQLELTRLQSLLSAAGFPEAAREGVHVKRGDWSLGLTCLLCCLSSAQMLLLLLLGRKPETQQLAVDKTDCQGSEDTNPLI